jgi:hypothetical protein
LPAKDILESVLKTPSTKVRFFLLVIDTKSCGALYELKIYYCYHAVRIVGGKNIHY